MADRLENCDDNADTLIEFLHNTNTRKIRMQCMNIHDGFLDRQSSVAQIIGEET